LFVWQAEETKRFWRSEKPTISEWWSVIQPGGSPGVRFGYSPDCTKRSHRIELSCQYG
jgi:hypothetical protein